MVGVNGEPSQGEPYEVSECRDGDHDGLELEEKSVTPWTCQQGSGLSPRTLLQ